mgnify:CR=1|tara:strand:+ start:18 stop:161 length:144 start_codon:yes stop_codon:yes gene_type:complete
MKNNVSVLSGEVQATNGTETTAQVNPERSLGCIKSAAKFNECVASTD